MLRLLVDFWRWWLSRLGVHLKSNARPATPSRVERSDKMSDRFPRELRLPEEDEFAGRSISPVHIDTARSLNSGDADEENETN